LEAAQGVFGKQGAGAAVALQAKHDNGCAARLRLRQDRAD